MIWKGSAQQVDEVSAYPEPWEPTSYEYETAIFT